MDKETVPRKRRFSRAISMSAMLLLSGCFLDQVQRSEENDIHRIEAKQAALRAQQDRAVTLQQQEEQLREELSERQLTLSELTNRVQQINAQNGHSLADNESSRRRYDLYLQQLHETNEQLNAAQQSAPAAAVEQRRERIVALKARLRSQLDALLR